MSLYDSTSSAPVVISFNSKDRIAGTNSSFVSAPIDIGINKFDSVCLVSASIPKSFYNMPSGYNTFSLREVTTRTITIPVGNYNKNNLITVLQTQLNTGAPVGWAYTVAYPASTGADTFKLTFTVSGNGGTQPRFTFATTTSTFRQLGFNEGSVNDFVANSLVSTNALNLSYILRAFIKSNICRNAQDGVLEELLNIGSFPSLSVMYYQQFNFDMNTREYNSDFTNSWEFTLVDGFDQIIELNGISWAFSLVFYQRNNTHELHKTDLQIKNEERIFSIETAQRNLQKQLVQTKTTITEDDTTKNLPPATSLGQITSGTNIPLPKSLYPIQPFSTGIYSAPIPEIQYPKD
jgi:hypothetical protein